MIYTPLKENIAKIGRPDQLEKWIKALRSGYYVQHRNSMCDGLISNSACCLHVAAIEVGGCSWRGGIGRRTPTISFGGQFARNANMAILATRLGTEMHMECTAEYLNDTAQLTFDQIADLLEGKTVDTEARA